jgi:hypothetical protein
LLLGVFGPVSAKRRRFIQFRTIFDVSSKEIMAMATDSRAPDSAEARQKKKALQLIEGQKAMHEYEEGMRAMRAKTEKLRALRLAHEAAEAKRIADEPAPARKKAKSSKAAKQAEAAE